MCPGGRDRPLCHQSQRNESPNKNKAESHLHSMIQNVGAWRLVDSIHVMQLLASCVSVAALAPVRRSPQVHGGGVLHSPRTPSLM